METNDKKRFFSLDSRRERIRANQGHSKPVDLALEPKVPPQFLYQGTAARFLDSILVTGLQRQRRHHVHLIQSKDIATAVGQRYGAPVILTIKAAQMQQEGFEFFQTENNLWLTVHVPRQYIFIGQPSRDEAL